MMTLFTFADGLLFSILSIGIVILLIGLIILAISPLKRLSQTNVETKKDLNQEQIISNHILDDDMMAAALVAAIDYRETIGKEPYLKSIKEIRNENL